MKTVRIVAPPVDAEAGVSLAVGTRVFVGDVEVPGVYKVELVAEVDNAWKAKIHCHGVLDGQVTALVDDTHRWQAPPTLIQALSAWLKGRRAR